MSQPQVPPTGSGDSGPRRRFSLRARVSLLAAFCVACAVALVSFGAYITVHRNLYAALDENLINRAEAAVQSPAVQTRLQSIPAASRSRTRA